MRGAQRLFLPTVIALCCLQPAFAASSAEQGRHLFAQSCAGCHDAHSTQRIAGPGLKDYFHNHHPQPTDAAVRALILHGRGVMPAFPQINASELTALLAYLRTL